MESATERGRPPTCTHECREGRICTCGDRGSTFEDATAFALMLVFLFLCSVAFVLDYC